jgi:ketol-acid reductoisomerase
MKAKRKLEASHGVEVVGGELRKMMSWIVKKK